MTTTDLYSGYDRDGKPTSRVLRPPGGGSSNIFGSEQAPQQQLRQQEQKSLDQNQNQGEQVAPQAPSQQQGNTQEDIHSRHRPRKQAQAYNPITGEEYPQDYGQKQSPAAKKTEDPDKTAVYNEISTPTPSVTPSGTPSGTPSENPMGTPGSGVRTSSRVLQPPGGATTTKLW